MYVEQIWQIAEERIGGNRSRFSLVCSGSTYHQPEGTLPKPQQLFEIRHQGRAGRSHLMWEEKQELIRQEHGGHKTSLSKPPTVRRKPDKTP
jgi:hypothetical protein